MSGSAVTITANNHHTTPLRIREIDAARALLGVAPLSYSEGGRRTVDEATESSVQSSMHALASYDTVDQQSNPNHCSSETDFASSCGLHEDSVSDDDVACDGYLYLKNKFKSSGSSGLETLAELAEREQNASMNRPIPSFLLPGVFDNFLEPASMSPSHMRLGRLRSVSNPEGMEKWDSLYNRRHFVLPASILEEELAEANEAVRQRSISPEKESCIHELPESTDTESESPSERPKNEHDEDVILTCFTGSEKSVDPDEMLRQARSRLLEDLSSETLKLDNCDRNDLTLPHSLSKYKEIYNKNGRIGIYTPSERAAIISRFNDKRTRRNWNKKIRYNCRKSLADRRLRVKGRFVKRSEQEELARNLIKVKEEGCNDPIQASSLADITVDGSGNVSHEDQNAHVNDVGDSEGIDDVNDEEMSEGDEKMESLDPTEDQPYRRLRRYTIT